MKRPAITVSIPYFRCKQYCQRAVESILAQSYSRLSVVVVNDGDADPPWDELSHIDDPRLIRFDLSANRGPYFANDVVLRATADPYLLIHDADDTCSAERLSLLLEILREDHAVAAFSAEVREFIADTNLPARKVERFRALKYPLTPAYEYRANNHGLFRADALRSVGGCYGGFRIAYDALLVNLLLMIGRVAYVDEPLYCRLIRPDSLSRSETTGLLSQERQQVHLELETMYSEVFDLYCEYLAGTLELVPFTHLIRQIRNRRVSQSDDLELEREAKRLGDLLQHSRSYSPMGTVVPPWSQVYSSDEGNTETAPIKGQKGVRPIWRNTEHRISVVIPARNESDNLVETIQSIFSTRSTDVAIEVIVIDDASTDGCCASVEDHLEEWAAAASSVRVVRLEEQVGVYRARNHGAQEAAGDILFMTDAHVRFCPDWDRHVLENICHDRVLAAVVTDIRTGSSGYGCVLNIPSMSTRWNTEPCDRRVPIQIAPCSGSVLYKDLFEEVGGYDEGMLIYGSGEPEFSVRAWLYGKEVVLVPELEVRHQFKGERERKRFFDQVAMFRLHNRLRFGLLYLDDQTSQYMLEHFAATHTEQALAVLKLIDESDVWTRKESLAERLLLDIGWFGRRFGVQA